jgi:hypothetical protein
MVAMPDRELDRPATGEKEIRAALDMKIPDFKRGEIHLLEVTARALPVGPTFGPFVVKDLAGRQHDDASAFTRTYSPQEAYE